MTEQTTSRGGFVENLGPLFDMWTYADGRECLEGDVTKAGVEEMALQFRQTEELLKGLQQVAEDVIGVGALLVFGDARSHAARALEVCERFARKYVG